MYERILVPLDGSKVGEAALPYIEGLVSKLSPEVKVEVTLLQVLSPWVPSAIGGEGLDEVSLTDEEIRKLTNAATDYLDKSGKALRNKGVRVLAKVGIGKAAEEIKKAANEINADLIVMTTHGRSGLSRWAFGSVTDRVLRSGNKPILLVRAPK